MKNPTPVRRFRHAFLILATFLASLTASAQSVFEPGTTYEDRQASNGAVGACHTNVHLGDPCAASFDVGASRVNAIVDVIGVTADVPPQKVSGSQSVSVYRDFAISESESGAETELLNSYVSADIKWAGLIRGRGFGTAAFKIEFMVIDLSDPSRPTIGYQKVDERSETGHFTIVTFNDVPVLPPIPTKEVDRMNSEKERSVLPVPLRRGRTYRVRLTLTVTATGGLDSDATSDFMAGQPGILENPQLYWDNLTISIGVDLMSAINDLEARVDSLAEENEELRARLDDHDAAIAQNRSDIDANTAAIETNEAAIADNTAAIAANSAQISSNAGANGRNSNRIAENASAIRDNERAIRDNADKIAALSGSSDFEARVDTLELGLQALDARLTEHETADGDTTDVSTLLARVEANELAIDTLAFDVNSWTSVIAGNTDAIVENASTLAGRLDSTAVLSAMVACHVHPSNGGSRTGYPEFEAACEEEETTVSAEETSPEVPTTYDLAPNYPNPFNPSTTIGFDLPKSVDVDLRIYDLQGREVAELVAETRAAGKHAVTWDATGFASGVYVYRIRAGSFVAARSLVLVK